MAKKIDVTTGKAVNYEYDSLGRLIHSYQTDNGTIQQHTEHLCDTENRLVSQSWTSGSTNHVMDFVYDNTGKPYALNYDGTTYYYVLNLQGDVISIITHWGESYGSYTYDAWGNLLAVSGDIAYLNPIRYRGYYYDSETGLYYLGSRYYDPAVKRFINADSATLAVTNSGELTDKNYFAYCNNSPVMQKDDGGELGHIALGAIVGGILGAAGEVVSQVATGTKLKDVNWKDVAIEGVNGAVTGGLMLSGLPVSAITAGRAITNAATSVLHSINNKENCGKAVLKAAGSAAGTYAMGSLTKPKGMGKLVINRDGRTVLRTGGYVLKKLWSFTFNKGSLSYKYKRYLTISSNSGKGAQAYAW